MTAWCIHSAGRAGKKRVELSPVRSCEIRLSSLTALDQALCVVYVEVARREESSSYEFCDSRRDGGT